MKVVILDALSERADAALVARGLAVERRVGLEGDALFAAVADADALIVRSSTRVDAKLLEAAAQTRIVARAGAGVDTIDVDEATRRGVAVVNTPHGNSVTTAEHALAMMMALARRIPQASASTHAGEWAKARFVGMELEGKTLAVIGCGAVGALVASRARALGMRLAVADPFLTAARREELGVEAVSLEDALARADVITLHAPLTDATRGMINAEALAKVKRGALLINCARGALVDEAAVVAALDEGRLGGAAVDVYAVEPARASPFFGRDDVVCTPHLGASTHEAQDKVAVQAAEQIADFLLDGVVRDAVNVAPISAEEAPRLAPLARLAGLIGSLVGQAARAPMRRIEIAVEGQDAETLNVRPLAAAGLAGALAPTLASVNMVNAAEVARARSVGVAERVERSRATPVRVVITAETDAGALRAEGVVGLEGAPRVVSVDGVRLDARLAEHMLLTTNHDRPGFVGALGVTLGEAGANIASLALGRDAVGGRAIALVALDAPLDDATLARVRALDLVVEATPLRLAAARA